METLNKTTRGEVLNVDPRNLRIPEGFNLREDFGDIECLSLSIEENGVRNPLSGYKGTEGGHEVYFITDGHRRYLATMAALERGVEIARIPFRVEGRTYNEVERICDMIIRNDGKNFTPYEHAKVFDKLSSKYGWTVAEISKKFGKSQNFVRQCLSYLTLPEEIQDSIKVGDISAGAAKVVVDKVGDVEKAVEVVKEAVQVAKSKGKKTATEKDVQAKEVKNVNTPFHAKNALKAMIVEMTESGMDIEDYEFFDRINDIYILLMDGKSLLDSIKISKKISDGDY